MYAITEKEALRIANRRCMVLLWSATEDKPVKYFRRHLPELGSECDGHWQLCQSVTGAFWAYNGRTKLRHAVKGYKCYLDRDGTYNILKLVKKSFGVIIHVEYWAYLKEK